MTDTDQEIGLGKACTKCGETKPIDDYYTIKRKNGRSPMAECKACIIERSRATYKKDPEKGKKRTKDWRADPDNKQRKNELERIRRTAPEVREKSNEYNREWRTVPDNNIRINARRRHKRRHDPNYMEDRKEYQSRPEVIERTRFLNREKGRLPERREYINAWRREKYARDPDYLCGIKCRGFIARVMKKARIKKDGRTHDILGYSPRDLRLRLECQLQPGMSWSNYGKWHIDHKKPIAAFLDQGIVDPKTINALCNLRPAWAEENLSKADKWERLVDSSSHAHRCQYAA